MQKDCQLHIQMCNWKVKNHLTTILIDSVIGKIDTYQWSSNGFWMYVCTFLSCEYLMGVYLTNPIKISTRSNIHLMQNIPIHILIRNMSVILTSFQIIFSERLKWSVLYNKYIIRQINQITGIFISNEKGLNNEDIFCI